VYSGGDDGVVRVWDAATGQPVDAWPGHTGSVSAVAVSGDGSRVYSGGLDGTLRTWDPTGNPGGTELRRADHLPGQNLALWDSPSGELLGATDDAWRWLGYPVSIDGRPDRLPAETFGPLPPLATVRTD
jgi:WD40 repeat protein